MSEVLLNAQILLCSLSTTTAIDLAPFTGTFDWDINVNMVDNPRYDALGYKTIVPGICSGKIGTKGAADYATSGVSVTVPTTKGAAREAFTEAIIIGGVNAVAGSAANFTRGFLEHWKSPMGNVGDLAAYELALGVDNAPVDGYLALPLATRGGVTGTAIQVGAVASGKRLWAALYILGGTFTNFAVTIESDNAVGFPSAATVLTFSTVSAAGGQFSSVAGPITDDWFRAKATIGSGTANYAVVYGVM